MKKTLKIRNCLSVLILLAFAVFGFGFAAVAQESVQKSSQESAQRSALPSPTASAEVASTTESRPFSFLNRYFDQSHNSFFPKSVGSIVDVQSQFPILWWDILILDSKDKKAPDWGKIQSECQEFARLNDAHIAKIFCGTSLADLARQAPVLSEWAHDYPLRHPRPSESDLASTMNASLAKATLPIGDLIKILRNDPYSSMTELQNLVRGDLKFHLESHGGFFYDSVTQRVLIPVQLNFPAPQTVKTAAVMAHANLFCPGANEAEGVGAKPRAESGAEAGDCRIATLTGAHAATLENESRVKSDLHSVSLLSALLLLGVVAFICVTKRWRLLLIVPPIFFAISLAAVLTVLVFGKIHGLTLAFGPGIVGLAMDYGLHIAFSNQPERIWKANLFGLLTTVIVLVIMMLSQIPLLQQLMFFSTVGVMLGSWFIYLIYKKYPTLLQVQSYGIAVPEHPAFSWAIVILVVLSLVGLGRLHLNLDMRQLGYQSPLTAELNEWAYKSAGFQSPLLQVFSGNDSSSAEGSDKSADARASSSTGDSIAGLNQRSLALAHEQRDWAHNQHIQINTIANLLPATATQTENLATWPEYQCSSANLGQSKWFQDLGEETQKFYAPFFNAVPCGDLKIKGLLESAKTAATPRAADQVSNGIEVPAYLRDFGNGKEWLTLWMPDGEAQTQAIKAKYPGVLSFVEMAMVFPRIFAAELIWMVPVSMFLAFLILVYYYRGFWLACLGVTPFFSGLGVYFGMNMIFGWNMSFISVIGLIMVFGFSLDFGIFAVDLMRRDKDKPDRGIWTALTVAAFINGCGFLPLMFCHHPVLVHLGRTLLFGTIGTYFGSIWGIPGLYRFLNREKA